MLEKEDFEELLGIESNMESIKKTIRELVIMRGKFENAYNSAWTKIRQKYSLNIRKRYTINRQTGDITEIDTDEGTTS